jgi:LCP family protein required for cell wall assembly
LPDAPPAALPDLPPRKGVWKRFLLGALIVIVATAGATSVAAIHEVDNIAKVFNGEFADLRPELAVAGSGKPQTILLIGSDQRAKGARDHESGARSDTMILMRLDPAKNKIALMSLPRDLKVEIPGKGVDKLNAAYSIGGTKLTLRTIKLFTGLRVNHVINIDFGGFRAAVSAIGCVYTDVDRRYYNDNTGADQYATIDIKAGYQKLCGQNALDYVRYRHTDTDIVRAARQQDFLRQAKAQVGTDKLIDNQKRLAKIVSKYTKSDIKGRVAVLRLLKLAIGSAGSPISEIHFPARIGASYVTARESAVQKATREFLGVKASPGPRGKPQPRSGSKRKRSTPRSSLVDISAAGRNQALMAARDVRGLEIFYPRRGVARSMFVTGSSPRAYKICGPNHGKCHWSYRMVIARDLLGEYYGLQGTTWKNPPIIKDPSETKKIGGREYKLYYDGDRLRLVAWQTKDATYWVSNTLLQTISERDMLAIARASKPLS